MVLHVSHSITLSNHCRSTIKRSLSDGNILCENSTPVSGTDIGQKNLPSSALAEKTLQDGANKDLSDSTSEISTCESDISYARLACFTPDIIC